MFNVIKDECQKTPFPTATWPFGRYMLVLCPTRTGDHRLVVRNADNTVAQLLPLHDPQLRQFERGWPA